MPEVSNAPQRTDWERVDALTDRIAALDDQRRLYALLTLRYEHAGALAAALDAAEAWEGLRRD